MADKTEVSRTAMDVVNGQQRWQVKWSDGTTTTETDKSPGQIAADAATAAAAQTAATTAQTAAAAFSPAEVQQQIQMILALKDGDPKLQEAWDAYQAKNIDAFRAAILESNFYKNNNAIARQRATAEKAQPGAWQQELDSYKSSTKRRLAAVGVQWSPSVETQVTVAFKSGMADASLDDLLVSSGVINNIGGSTLGTVNQLKGIANDYGVSSLYNKDYWNAKSAAIFAGTTTLEDIKKEIQDLSASTFPAYADGIASGVSLKAQGSSVLQTIATYLERDPGTLTFDDPLARQIMQYVDPVTGKPARMPQWQAEKMVKSTSAWAETKNARDTIDSLSYKVLNDWGLA